MPGFFLVLAGVPSGAMDWPGPGGTLTANFGVNEQGRPCLGTVFRSEGSIYSADKGELVFRRPQEDRASRLPSPLGSWLAYDHGDGILGIYSRFAGEDGAPDPPAGPAETPAAEGPPGGDSPEKGREPPVRARQGDVIAASGISGWSGQRGFYFALYDRRERRWVNPSLIIVPFPDDRPPEILSVQLQDSGGRLIPPGQNRIGQGRYSIIVNVADALSRSSPVRLAPHRLGVSLNGAEAGSLSLETFYARDGVLSIRRNGLTPVSAVYAPYPALNMGEAWFTRGQTSLELIARDVAGNEASLIRRLDVE